MDAQRELEIKIRVTDHEGVRMKLRALGASRIGAVVESNAIFDAPDNKLSLSAVGLRLRGRRDSEGAWLGGTMTVKGPPADGPVKSREEAEVSVDDLDKAERALSLLGYRPVVRYAKRRESWKLGGCHVELDVVPYLGAFVEIEGPSIEAVKDVQKQLELEDDSCARMSYVELLADYCAAHGLDPSDIRFPD